jgi:hypothetical protein
VRAVLIVVVLLDGRTPVEPAERVDPRILPASVRYARNTKCNSVSIRMPLSTHSAIEGNNASPKPRDMPLSQGDNLICFAYATADMISQRLGREISALDVATKYYFVDASRLARSPNSHLQLHLREMGDYRTLIAESRAITEISIEGNPRGLPYIDKLEGGEENIAALLYNIGGYCADKALPSYDGYAHFAFALSFRRKWMRLFSSPSISTRALAGVPPQFRSSETDGFNAAWISRVEQQCHRRRLPAPLLPVNYRVAENAASFLQLVEERRPPSAAQVNQMFAMID